MLNAAFKNLTFSASWNHGKIVAIGGKTKMTGGVNYWPEYVGKSAKADTLGKIKRSILLSTTTPSTS